MSKFDRLFWKEAKPNWSLEKRGNFYVDPGESVYGFCPKCESPTIFSEGIAFCEKCGTKIVKSFLVA